MEKRVIYFAGGCFWGVEKFMSSLPGVISAVSGYANASVENPTYKQVTEGDTKARETVKVVYDDSIIHLKTLVFSYFTIIDPTIENRQGHDVGSQYQAGIYYGSEEDYPSIKFVLDIESKRYDEIKVEIKMLENFYAAEEYHQKYLDKNPQGYCHVPFDKMKKARELKVDAGNYNRLSDKEIEERVKYSLGNILFVEKLGMYVDVTTDEPLFEEKDKIAESVQWIDFQKPVDGFVVINHGGHLLSRIGNLYLGELISVDGQAVYRVSKVVEKLSFI